MTESQPQFDESSNREDLTGEHAFTDTGQLILLGIFLVTWITDSFIFHYSVFLQSYVPLYVRLPAGIIVLIFSALLGSSAHRAVFGKAKLETGPITRGVFSIIRHPMYFGSGLFFFGLMIITLSIASAAVCVLIFIFYYLVSKFEETLLLQRYGTLYEGYRTRVPMLFPLKLRRK
jgi:protein-S-isoprenylcysteine O-methyltransferase Ste14